MGEFLALLAITAAGAVVLVRRTRLPALVVTFAAAPVGLGMYAGIGTVAVVLFDTADPIVLLAATGLAAAALALAGERSNASAWAGAGGSLALTAVVAALAAVADATRLTPDSIDYASVADILLEPNALDRLSLFVLEARNLLTGLVHTLGSLDGRPYAELVNPVVTVAGLALFVWVASTEATVYGRRAALALVGAATVFVLTSGRVLYDVFYLNSHGILMVMFFGVVAAGYLAITRNEPSWMALAAAFAPSLFVARAEGPLLALIALAPALTSSALPTTTRALTSLPAAVVGVVWFGLGIYGRHADEIALSPLEPIVGGVIIAVGLPLLAALGAIRLLARPLTVIPWLVAAALAGILAFEAIRDKEVLFASMEATAANMVGRGGWGFTWPVLLALLVAAVSVGRFSGEAMLTAPIAGFFALFWASVYLRDAAYRVGAGDSGNRMLAHVILVVVLYCLVAIAQRPVGSASVERVS